jgi:hypothetical protein
LMQFRNQLQILNQMKPRHGKPPDHPRRFTTFDNYSVIRPFGARNQGQMGRHGYPNAQMGAAPNERYMT